MSKIVASLQHLPEELGLSKSDSFVGSTFNSLGSLITSAFEGEDTSVAVVVSLIATFVALSFSFLSSSSISSSFSCLDAISSSFLQKINLKRKFGCLFITGI